MTRENQVGTLNFMPPEALVPDALHANGFTRVSVNPITAVKVKIIGKY